MTLSYDFTFLALLDFALRPDAPQFERQNCLYNPLKRKACCLSHDALHFGASAAVITLYYKVRDNIADERGPKKLLYRLALPFAAHARKKALGEYHEIDRVIGACMQDQAELEHNKCDSVDRAGEPTAKSLACLFSSLSSEEGQRRVLERFGYLLGRWIYLADALDDIEEDRERGRYNPFLLRSRDGTPIEQLRQDAVLSLNLTIGEMIKTFELLETRRYRGILENVLNLGLKSVVERICCKKKGESTHDRPL